jgi:hypothetical protein
MVVNKLTTDLSRRKVVPEKSGGMDKGSAGTRSECRRDLKCRSQSSVSRCGSRGTAKGAFNDENSHIVVEVVSAKLCRGVIDSEHEVFGR